MSASSRSRHLTHPAYRADIDGLRAISVLAVVGFHAFPSWVSGGFIGVDIFFVISGFLISTIIAESLERNSFSFLEFYTRRIKRIFPALLLVLIASFIFGWFALLADEYKQLGKHIAGGAGFVLNFLLWNESGYFDNSAATKPLLHIWSLSVEEQFYLVWPLFLWLAWKKQLNLLGFSVMVGVLSFLLNAEIMSTDKVAAFYSPQTRFWELMAGSVLAQIRLRGTSVIPVPTFRFDAWARKISAVHALQAKGKTLNNAQSWAGVLLIAIGFLVINKERAFPGWWALLPTLGAVLVISAGAQAWMNRVVLSNRVLVWFGLISFPLYLWHWPLLSFASILWHESPPRLVRICLVLISIFLAWMTYELIEKPVRFGKQKEMKATTLIALMACVGAAGIGCFALDGLYHRCGQSINDREVRHYRRGLEGAGVINCNSSLNVASKDFYCRKTVSSPVLAIIGDSHAEHLFYGFAHGKNDKFNKAIILAQGRCLPTLGFDTAITGSDCAQQLTASISLIKATPSIKYVILSGNKLLVERDPERSLNGYRSTITTLKDTNRQLVFVIDTPSFQKSNNPSKCEPQPLWIRTALFEYPKFCRSATEADLQITPKYYAVVEQLRTEYPDVMFYEPHELFCRHGKCKLFEDSKLLFGDFNHLSIYGSQLVANSIIDELEKLKY